MLRISVLLGFKSALATNTKNVERKNCSNGYIPIFVNILKIPFEKNFLNSLYTRRIKGIYINP